MPRWLLLVALGPAAAPAAAQATDPRAVVRAAVRAVEQDGADALAARWQSPAGGHVDDRAAQLGLATLARLRYDYPAAERGYRALVADARDRYAVYAQLGLAAGLVERGFERDATPVFESALGTARTVGDRIGEGEALLALAFVRGRRDGVRVAEATIDSAARLFPADAPELQARLASHRAIVFALRGRAAAASAAADSGVRLARRAHDLRVEAVAFRVVGQVLQYRGQFDSALVALHQSEVLYRRARSRSALANSRIWHAEALGNLMRYGEMRDMARRGLVDGEATHNPSAVGRAHRAFGVLAQMLGDWPAAAAHLKRAYAISAATGDSSTMRTNAQYLALTSLAAGDTATSRRLADALLAWARQTDDAVTQFETQRILANIAAREGDTAAVTRALAAARAQLPQLPSTDRPVLLLHDEARHALARGDLVAAERALDAYLRLAQRGSCVVCRFDARLRLADVHARRGDAARAERELVAATDEIDEWRARLGDAELRTLAFQSAVTVDAAASEPGATAARAARVLAALASAGRVEVAFELAERWRARELGDRIARDAAWRAMPSAPDAGGSRGGALATASRHAVDITSALPDARVALLEYVAADSGPVTLFVVQRSGVRARVLPTSGALAADVARFGSLLESGADAARLGRALGALLVEPALPLLDARVTRLVVVPDGPLHRLPFDALRLADGRYVLERYAVGVAPSASVLAGLWAPGRRPAAPSPLRLLAFGDPDLPAAVRGAVRDISMRATAALDSAAPDSATASRDAGDVGEPLAAVAAEAGLPRLNGAAREARLVARYAPVADVRLGARASAAFLKGADLRRYRVLHFASHAIVDERSVAGSAIVLAAGGGESGFVSAGDLAALRLDADLVVLSQCRSAGGVLVIGEGVQGLTSPLLQAGARAVVATAWRIGDQSTVPFIDAFYAALARGLSVAEALRHAKLQAVRRGDPSRTWGAFLTIGDPLVVVPLRPARPPVSSAALAPR